MKLTGLLGRVSRADDGRVHVPAVEPFDPGRRKLDVDSPEVGYGNELEGLQRAFGGNYVVRVFVVRSLLSPSEAAPTLAERGARDSPARLFRILRSSRVMLRSDLASAGPISL